jgi:aminoglycoside 6'-N-acetyltransferase
MALTLPAASERLVLRRFGAADAEPFHAYRNDPDVARYQSWDGIARDEAEAFVREQASAELGAPGRWCQIAIALGDSGELVGDVGVCVAGDGASAEIGFTLARAHQGRGYATEAVARAIDLLFDAGVERVEATADERNAASIALLRRLGLRHARTEDAWFRDAMCRELAFEVTRTEWRASRVEPRRPPT